MNSANRPIHFEKNPDCMKGLLSKRTTPEGRQRALRASKGGRWVCDSCCQYQRGSKAAHKAQCKGFQRRTPE